MTEHPLRVWTHENKLVNLVIKNINMLLSLQKSKLCKRNMLQPGAVILTTKQQQFNIIPGY